MLKYYDLAKLRNVFIRKTKYFGGKVVFSSNPQPIGFRENLLVKRPKFFYCTYSLGITETS